MPAPIYSRLALFEKIRRPTTTTAGSRDARCRVAGALDERRAVAAGSVNGRSRDVRALRCEGDVASVDVNIVVNIKSLSSEISRRARFVSSSPTTRASRRTPAAQSRPALDDARAAVPRRPERGGVAHRNRPRRLDRGRPREEAEVVVNRRRRRAGWGWRRRQRVEDEEKECHRRRVLFSPPSPRRQAEAVRARAGGSAPGRPVPRVRRRRTRDVRRVRGERADQLPEPGDAPAERVAGMVRVLPRQREDILRELLGVGEEAREDRVRSERLTDGSVFGVAAARRAIAGT